MLDVVRILVEDELLPVIEGQTDCSLGEPDERSYDQSTAETDLSRIG